VGWDMGGWGIDFCRNNPSAFRMRRAASEPTGGPATVGQLRAEGLLIQTDNFFGARSAQLAALTVRYAVPAIFYPNR
jgi:hypothetical protein